MFRGLRVASARWGLSTRTVIGKPPLRPEQLYEMRTLWPPREGDVALRDRSRTRSQRLSALQRNS